MQATWAYCHTCKLWWLHVQCHHKKYTEYFVQVGDKEKKVGDKVHDSSWETGWGWGTRADPVWGYGEKGRMGRHESMNKGPEAQTTTLCEGYDLFLTPEDGVMGGDVIVKLKQNVR